MVYYAKMKVLVFFVWFFLNQQGVCGNPIINTGVAPSWAENGAMQLLIKAYTENMIDDLQNDGDISLTEEQALKLKDKLRGLYQYLRDNPVLMERRLYVGSKVPRIRHERQQQQQQQQPQRMFEEERMELNIEYEVCPSRAEWRKLGKAKDINDTDVDVYQPDAHEKEQQLSQWFYYVTCNHIQQRIDPNCPNCCIGIDRHKYSSICSEKYNYVMAYMRVPGTRKQWDWNWIQVPSSCSCAIQRHF
ncbi:uncharacterized protein LOC141915298 [Tubulanus polymorphus]|uniref:uncharacterized protein LOC141915298 n=1 Tax=Tubulanus polymorphus TaxID=672921 RepID=UPI003DA52DB7